MKNSSILPTDTFDMPGGGKLEISFICHASLAMNIDGVVVYVDPVSDFSPYSDYTPDYSEMDRADLILVTHQHSDHCDSASVAALTKEDTRIIANSVAAGLLGDKRVEIMANGDIKKVGKISITAVPAYNTTEGREGFHPATGRDNGYIIEAGGLIIYVSSDTEIIPKEVLDMNRIDIAFLPVNQPYTMTPEQAIYWADQLDPVIFYPVHQGDTNIARLIELHTGNDFEMRLREMQ